MHDVEKRPRKYLDRDKAPTAKSRLNEAAES